MESMKTTMYAGAFLATAVVLMTLGIVGDALFHTETPEQFGYEVAEAEGSAPAAGAEEPVELASIVPMLASADVAAGETVFKKCASCHNVADGASNKIGPNLWSIVNRDIAADAEFKYSSALVAYGEGKQWSFDELNGFLLKPKDWVKGTSMGFAGLKKEGDRANLIAYLNQQAASPAPVE